MNLEFEQGHIQEKVKEELAFNEYLSIFNEDIPILPFKILTPIKETEGIKYFKKLSNYLEIFKGQKTSLNELFKISKELPNLQSVINALKTNQLELFHLYTLGKYCTSEKKLVMLEQKLNIPLKSSPIESINKLLTKHMALDFSSFKEKITIVKYRTQIQKIENDISTLLNEYEKKIESETKIRFIYPYPKEYNKLSDIPDKLKSSSLIKIKKNNNKIHVEYNLPAKIKTLITEKEALLKKIQKDHSTHLSIILSSLMKTSNKLQSYYKQRTFRVYNYLLLVKMNGHNLILPNISEKHCLELNKGCLPILQKNRGSNYSPLSIKLTNGSNVLFGANMAGKTTVLKTLFFLITLVRFGLPLPANSFKLKFPTDVLIHLKSSGNLEKNLSSFGEELNFFSRSFPNGSYIFIDELFHTTNPISGKELSIIMLDYFKKRKTTFFCTTQYPEILKLSYLNLFKMKDFDFNELNKSKRPLLALMKKMPFEVIKMTKESMYDLYKESKTPLKMALFFPLNETIKKKIKKSIEI